MELSKDTVLEPGVQVLQESLRITRDGVRLDGRGAVLVCSPELDAGIVLKEVEDVTIRNLTVLGRRHGVHARDCRNLTLEKVRVSATDEIPPGTAFLDIFHSPGAYPAGIRLESVADSTIYNCDLSHQFCGLAAYDCRGLGVEDTHAGYGSGFGFYLSGVHTSTFTRNNADFCCRWHARGDGSGHMGADAAGFVIVNGSSKNVFRENTARMGGDGFFLAGLRHDGTFRPCNHNLFETNDASFSPNISFEATFSEGNVFRGNLAARSNYGFWLGFSRSNLLEKNRIHQNRQAGIAVENGIEMVVRSNEFHNNGYGILLWSKRIPQFDAAVPENDTSRGWQILDNDFQHNRTAIRIAADQDHGLRPHTAHGRCPPLGEHRLAGNRFTGNTRDTDLPHRPGENPP